MFQQGGGTKGHHACLANADHRKPPPIHAGLEVQPIQQEANIKNPLAQQRPAKPQAVFGTIVVGCTGNGIVSRFRFSRGPKVSCENSVVPGEQGFR